MQNKQAISLAWHKNWFRVEWNKNLSDENILFVKIAGADNWFIVS